MKQIINRLRTRANIRRAQKAIILAPSAKDAIVDDLFSGTSH